MKLLFLYSVRVMLSMGVCLVLSQNPVEVIAPLTTFHDMLLFGSTEPMRQAASGILTSLIEYSPQFGKQLSDTVIQGLNVFKDCTHQTPSR